MTLGLGHAAAPLAGPVGWLVRPVSRWRGWALLAVKLGALAAANCFWRHLATGRWIDLRPSAYYQDLTTGLGEVLRHPLDVVNHPWMILVTGLTLGAILFVPVAVSVLYRGRVAAWFVLLAAVCGHAPVLALALGIGCALAALSRRRWPAQRDALLPGPSRSGPPGLAVLLGLLPVAAYLALSALASVDAAAVQPVQRWALYAPFFLALTSAALAGAMVVGLARVVRYRPGVLCAAMLALLAAPVAAFYARVGRDELDYALIVNRTKEDRIYGDDCLFEDEPLSMWARQHRAEGLNPQTTRVRVEEDLYRRRDDLVGRCRRFMVRHPRSRRRAAIGWLAAQAASLRLDESALAIGLIRCSAAFPQPASVEAWEALRRDSPGTPQAALADWRLGEMSLRILGGSHVHNPELLVRKADQHLHRALERLGAMFPAAADRQGAGAATPMFGRVPDFPDEEYCRGALETVERIIWLMTENDVVIQDGKLKDPDSAEALGAYLDVDLRRPDALDRLKLLLGEDGGRRERTKMGDNLLLAVALKTPDIYERADQLVVLADGRPTDAAIEANMELGKLTLRSAEAPDLARRVQGIKAPGEYLRIVMRARPNPFQRKAAELLASQADRATGRATGPQTAP